MKKILFAFTLLIFCLSTSNFAQEKWLDGKLYELKGIVKDKTSAVFIGVPVFFKNKDIENFALTDVNGEFTVVLMPGNYEVAVKSGEAKPI